MSTRKKQAKANVTPLRQRSQYTCMAASLCMCLQAIGVKTNEDEVNKVMGCRPGQGASWEDAIAAAQHFGARATLVSPASVHQMKEWTDRGVPIMIAWNPEGRDWSHASVVYDVDHDLNVHVADPNCPDPEQLVRILSKKDFYGKWYEKWPKYLFRRPACAIEREITSDGRQVMASQQLPSDQNRREDMSYLISVEEMENLLDKKAAEDEKEAKFEEGKHADPTKNMSKEDAAKWKAENEKNKDKFKKKGEDEEEPEDEKEARFDKGPLTPAEKKKLSPEFKGEIGKHPLPKKAARERITAKEDEQKKTARSGLYGFTKKTQRDCESAVNKLRRSATSIAKRAYSKDERVGEFFNTHASRTKSSTARILMGALKSSLPKFASEDFEKFAKEASPRKYGMYGFPEKTSRIGLQACLEVKEAAGRIASDLHARRSDRYDNITSFLKEHGKTARCHEAKLILSYYPESTLRFASQQEDDHQEELRKFAANKWIKGMPEITIQGRPIVEPDTTGEVRYPRLDRRGKWNAVDLANNSIPLGYARVNINGKNTVGIFFRATMASAKGITWDSGMKVYPVRDPIAEEFLPGPPNLFVADTNRVGVYLKQGSEQRVVGNQYGNGWIVWED